MQKSALIRSGCTFGVDNKIKLEYLSPAKLSFFKDSNVHKSWISIKDIIWNRKKSDEIFPQLFTKKLFTFGASCVALHKMAVQTPNPH